MQANNILLQKKQEKIKRSLGTEKILQELPQTHNAQRNKINPIYEI